MFWITLIFMIGIVAICVLRKYEEGGLLPLRWLNFCSMVVPLLALSVAVSLLWQVFYIVLLAVSIHKFWTFNLRHGKRSLRDLVSLIGGKLSKLLSRS